MKPRAGGAAAEAVLAAGLDLPHIVASLAVAMVVTDARGCIVYANPAFEKANGHTLADLLGKRPSVLHSGLQNTSFYRRMWRSLAKCGAWSGEIWNRRGNGQVVRQWLEIRAVAGGEHYVGSYCPRTARGGQAPTGFDPLTGLLDRARFVEAADRLRRQCAAISLLTLDVEGFTAFNEQAGLAAGDHLLQDLAQRCGRVAAASGHVTVLGRVGADELALAIDHDDASELEALVCHLQAVLAEPFDLGDGGRHRVAFAFGQAGVPADAPGAAAALVCSATARGGSRPAGLLVGRYGAHDADHRLLGELGDAIRHGLLRADYQPQVALVDGALVGVEALARWRRADGTEVPPTRFVALAEQHGLIVPLGECMLDLALRDLARWRAAGLVVPRMAVNFSAAQFQLPDAAARVRRALAAHGLPANALELELTESILIGDIPQVLQTLRELHAAGVALSIDDFGTGYSSLAYLRRFPIDRLKIDRSFVAQMHDDASAMEVVAAIVRLAHHLRLRCVAEGVETAAQRDALAELGVDEIQGYLASRPMAAEQFAEWAAAQGGERAAPRPMTPRRPSEAHYG